MVAGTGPLPVHDRSLAQTAFAKMGQQLYATLWAGRRVVENVAVIEDERGVRLAAFDRGHAGVQWRDRTTVDRSRFHPRVIAQLRYATYARDHAPSRHNESVRPAANELVIAGERVEQDEILFHVILNADIPDRPIETDGAV
jgi:hypothetical protein